MAKSERHGRTRDSHRQEASERSVEDDLRPEIAARAYERYLARGAGHGHDVDDWLQAEREVRDRSR